MESYPRFHNEVGVPIVRIGCRGFECIGNKPPQDHPHIYLNMGDASEIVCPYCSTLFRFDPTLGTREADPANCAYGETWIELKSSHAASLFMLPAANHRQRPLCRSVEDVSGEPLIPQGFSAAKFEAGREFSATRHLFETAYRRVNRPRVRVCDASRLQMEFNHGDFKSD